MMRTPFHRSPLLTLLLLLALCLPAFAQDDADAAQPLHIHIISASKEYKSEPSLRAWSESITEQYPDAVRFTASWAEDGGKELSDAEGIDDADLLVVFTRRMTLPADQWQHIHDYLQRGGPVIGIRTASHAFNNMKGFDADVLGGSYSGHGGDETITVKPARETKEHPMLDGITGWEGPGKLYNNKKNPESSVTLLTATGGKGEMPVAWVHEYQLEGGEIGRAFYTSLGIPADFKNEQFQRLLFNAVEWSTGRDLDDSGNDASQDVASPYQAAGVNPSAPGSAPSTTSRRADALTSAAPAAATSVEAEESEEAVDGMTEQETKKLYDDIDLPTGDPDPRDTEAVAIDVNRDVPEYPGHLGEHMDYGPALASSLIFDPGDKETQLDIDRALTVRLSDDVSIAYDMNTMSPIGAWNGDFLDLTKTHHQSMKGSLPPRSTGAIFYRAPEGPAWAWTGKGEAPQNPDRFGPLPKEWIDYHGYHLAGDRLIFSYDVEGRHVLESPAVVMLDGKPVLAISYWIDAGSQRVFLKAFGREAGTMTVGWIVDHGGGGSKAISTGVLSRELYASKTPSSFTVFIATDDTAPATMARKGAKVFEQPDLMALIDNGAPPRWTQPITTDGSLGKPEQGYANDDLTLPTDNPYGAWMQPADIAFMRDGTLVMTTLGGDVWLVSNITDDLKGLVWKRFATGLYEPMGVYVDHSGDTDSIYVTGRDRITKLVDINDDREADFYQNFYDGGNTDPSYHGFVFGLDRDAEGYWYLARSGRKINPDRPEQSSVIRIAPDGRSDEVWATGFRHPNGLAVVGPKDGDQMLLVSDNQGEWVPASKQSLIQRGGFYGYYKNGESNPDTAKFQEPLFWLPHTIDNSSGEAGYASDSRWGPLAHRYLHPSYGACRLFYFMPQTVGDTRQAAVVALPFFFKSGIMRTAVNPADGQVYVSGLKGWDTEAREDGCLSRVRYTGTPATMVTGVEVHKDGVLLRFNQPVAQPDANPSPRDISVRQWNYIYSKNYGSPEMSVAKPDNRGEDEVPIQSLHVADDGLSLKIGIANLQPVNQMMVNVTGLQDREGNNLGQNVYLTINAVPQEQPLP